MKKLTFIFVMILLSFPAPAFAEFHIQDGKIKRIEGNEQTVFVRFSWKVSIYADQPTNSCILFISLRDQEDMEFSRITEFPTLKEGWNDLTGTDMIKSEDWFRLSDTQMSMKCY